MVKRKRNKRQTAIYKTYTSNYQTKGRVIRTPLKTGGETQVLRKCKQHVFTDYLRNNSWMPGSMLILI